VTQVYRTDGAIEIAVGEPRVDAAAAPGFKALLDGALAEGPNRVILDLTEVSFMDSTGLGVLVGLLKKLGADGSLVVCGAQPPVRRLFELTRLDTLFRLTPSLEAARQELHG
jgi:anti-sigma B factor antagonist